MDSKKLDHKALLRKGEPGTPQKGRAIPPKWEESLRSDSCGQQTSKREHVPGSPEHAWGPDQMESKTQAEGSKLQGGWSGKSGVKSILWHSTPISGHQHLSVAINYRIRGKSVLLILFQHQKHIDLKAKAKPGQRCPLEHDKHQHWVCWNQPDKIHFLLGGKVARKYPHVNTYICGIENIHNPLQYRVVFAFVLLANQFNVS